MDARVEELLLRDDQPHGGTLPFPLYYSTDPTQMIAEAIEGVSAGVELICESVGCALGGLHKAAKARNPAQRWKHLLLGFSPFIVIGMLIGGWYVYSSWKEAVLQQRIEATTELVQSELDRLNGQRDANGKLLKPSGPQLEVKDAWGEPLTVRYEARFWGESLTVQSSGPDRKPGTRDDIEQRIQRLEPAKAGRAVLDKIKKLKPKPAPKERG